MWGYVERQCGVLLSGNFGVLVCLEGSILMVQFFESDAYPTRTVVLWRRFQRVVSYPTIAVVLWRVFRVRV